MKGAVLGRLFCAHLCQFCFSRLSVCLRMCGIAARFQRYHCCSGAVKDDDAGGKRVGTGWACMLCNFSLSVARPFILYQCLCLVNCVIADSTKVLARQSLPGKGVNGPCKDASCDSGGGHISLLWRCWPSVVVPNVAIGARVRRGKRRHEKSWPGRG